VLIRLLIIFSVFFLIDIINVFGLKRALSKKWSSVFRSIYLKIYIGVGILLLIYIIVHVFWVGEPGTDYLKYRSYYYMFGIIALVYFPRMVYFAVVIWQTVYYVIKRIFKPNKSYAVYRRKEQHYFIQKFGLFLSILSFGFLLYGMIWGKSDFIVREQTIAFKDLPKSFNGFRIAQVSDMHLGSFSNPKDVKKGLKLLSDQNVDIILFTGDMVNNVASEVDTYIEDFKKLNPKFGMFAILGNHDMGDYVKWKQADMKYVEIKKLINKEEEMGFKMLLNENKIIYRGKDSIALIGVENWGKPPFKKYGNLEKAMRGVNDIPFKILMSHDPSHFDLVISKETDIQLTLSGHTHGMQVGVNCCGIVWSPISWMYQYWNGLYEVNNKFLYVNPGFGFIGLPARIGIRPEITVITLRRIKGGKE